MPKSVELLFYRGVGIPGALVRIGTNSPFAHVAIRVEDVVASGKDLVYEAVAPRVLCRNYDDVLPWSPDKHATHVTLPDGCDLSRMPDLSAFLESTINDPYDWAAIAFDVIGHVLPACVALRDDDHRKWDCSRLATAALRVLGWSAPAIADLRMPVSPGDLYRLLPHQMEITVAAPTEASTEAPYG